MKHFKCIFFFTMLAWQAFSQQCPDSPSGTFDAQTLSIEVNSAFKSTLCRDYSMHNKVYFLPNILNNNFRYFLDPNTADGIPAFEINNGIKTESYTYPISENDESYQFSIIAKSMDLTDTMGNYKNIVRIKASFSGGYANPDLVIPISSTETFTPPISGAYPPTSPYNGNVIGGAHAYIKFAPAHSGKLVKPLIFVDGIDFDENTYTVDGNVIRHGSTGWDVFMQGNDDSEPNPFDTFPPVFRNYPAAFNTLLSSPNNYDIIFLDFANGADYIEKNGLLLVELIKWVNERKNVDAISGSPACENVVIGASMGGQVAKWALSFMEENNIPHQTHTYVSFDSPQQGAHIPLSLQGLALLTSLSGANTSQWKQLNAPAARQMLILHLGAEIENGKVAVDLRKDLSCFSENSWQHHADLSLEYPKTDSMRNNFKSEILGLGYPQNTRNLGISCGSKTGATQAQGVSNLLFEAGKDVGVNPLAGICTNGANPQVGYAAFFQLQNSLGGGPGTKSVFHATVCQSSSYTYGPKTLFAGFIPKNFIGFKINNSEPPCEYMYLNIRALANYPNYENAAGNSRTEFIGLQKYFEDLEVDVAYSAGKFAFMNNISTLDIRWPMDEEHLIKEFNPVSLPQQGLTPFDAVYAPSKNLRHVEITNDMVDWLLTQMEIGLTQSMNANLNLSQGQIYNFGNRKNMVPNSVISNGGKLSVNLSGNINYMTPSDPVADKDHFEVFLGSTCGEGRVVTVKKGGELLIGDPSVSNKTGAFTVLGNCEIHVESGGVLKISDNSQLLISKNAKLTLDEGAIVKMFEHPGGGLSTEGKPRIHLLAGGRIIFNGNINFSGDGFFDIEADSKVIFPSDFTFNGSGKRIRHFRINSNAILLKQGGRLAFQNAKFQISCDAKVRIEGFDRLLLNSTTFESINNESCEMHLNNNLINPNQIGFEMENGQTIFIKSSDFNNLRTGLRAHNISGDIRVESCNFKEGRAVDFYQIKYAMLKNVTGSSATFVFDEVSQSVSLDHVALTDACSICGTQEEGIVKLTDVKMLWMTGGLIEQSLGGAAVLRGIDARLGENNVTMKDGATIQNTYIGVEINGGLPGHQYNTDFGLMRMDCARILNCSGPSISGEDVLLDIDAGINSNGLRPNEFRKGGIDGISMFFDICYRKRQPSEILANDNFWNITGNGGVPEPIVDYQLNKWLGGACGDPLPLVTNSVAPAYNANCPHRGGGDLGRDRDLPQPGYKDCSIGAHNLYGGFVTAWESIDSALVAADIAEVAPDLSAAISAFAPLSAVDSVTLASNAPVCRHYTEVARVFTIQSAQEHDQQQQALRPANAANVTLAPNPAGDGFALNLPQGDWQVSAVDAFGRVVYQQQLSEGAQYIVTAAWAEGIYTVFYRAVAEPGVFGQIKVAVAR